MTELPRQADFPEIAEKSNWQSKSKQRPVWLNTALVSLAAAFAIAVYFLCPPEMEGPARQMAAIFTLALVLWVTEAIPLFATSLVVLMTVGFVVNSATGLEGDIKYTAVLAAFSDPIIWIFLGGFILAKGVQREGLDLQIAAVMLRPFGTRPLFVMAGLMVVTAVFSMFMSNTAATAMMIILVHPILKQLPNSDPLRKGLVLCVPFAANIGGIGTPIGTPPNAIAIGQIEKLTGTTVGFGTWMVMMVPLMFGTLVAMWLAIGLIYRPKQKAIHLELPTGFKLTRNAAIVYGTFGLTVLLWMTGEFHGIPLALVSVVPAALLTMTGVLGRQEFNTLEWDILLLIAGGIALGTGIDKTGLDTWVVKALPAGDVSFFVLAATFSLLAVGLSTVISNSVAANLLCPIAVAVASVRGNPMDPIVLGVLTGLMTSFAMGLPISTPPNALAYSTGEIKSIDMMKVGGLCSVLGTILIVFSGPTVITAVLHWFAN